MVDCLTEAVINMRIIEVAQTVVELALQIKFTGLMEIHVGAFSIWRLFFKSPRRRLRFAGVVAMPSHSGKLLPGTNGKMCQTRQICNRFEKCGCTKRHDAAQEHVSLL